MLVSVAAQAAPAAPAAPAALAVVLQLLLKKLGCGCSLEGKWSQQRKPQSAERTQNAGEWQEKVGSKVREEPVQRTVSVISPERTPTEPTERLEGQRKKASGPKTWAWRTLSVRKGLLMNRLAYVHGPGGSWSWPPRGKSLLLHSLIEWPHFRH